jgi:ABC-2 type transport system permease protein
MADAAMLLQRLRWTQLRNGWHLLRSRSLTRPLTIAAACLITWGTLFGFSFYAFFELRTRWNFPLNGGMLEVLLDVMFFFLSVLLIFSSGILLYTSLFTSLESRFLLTTPVPDDHLFAYKFQGALAFSSWGFLLLGSPILISYGLQVQPAAPWHFFLFLPLFFVGFVLIPGSIGAILCLVLVNVLPKNLKQLVQAIGVALVVVASLLVFRALRTNATAFRADRMWFENFFQELGQLSGGLMPHHWVAGGLRAAAVGEMASVAYYLALVWSNGLLLYLAAIWAGRRLFRRGVERVLTGGTLLGTRVRPRGIDGWLERTLFFLDRPTRLLLVKDFRTFRRDPAQWLQLSIFVGLLLFYFSGMRHFFERDIGPTYKNGISFMTLTALSLLLCAYAGRFIFPLLSLEGRTFWLLGLLPLDRARLVWGKFAFATCTCLLPSLVLMLTADLILAMPGRLLAVHLTAVVIISLGLSGLSVGLGTLMPNFREPDPSKIAIGFGGTLNLVAGFLYLLVVLGTLVAPMHLAHVNNDIGDGGPVPWFVWLLAVVGVIAGLAGAIVPLRLGTRHLERLEF